MTKLLGPLLVVIVVAAGAWYALRPHAETVGAATAAPTAAPGAPPTAASAPATKTVLVSSLTKDQAGKTVQVEGTISKECPSGCWAYVKDSSGEIRMDTKAGGFTLPLKRVGSKIKVVGKVQLNESGSPELNATSAEVK